MKTFKGWSYDGTKLEDLGFFIENYNLDLTPSLVAGDLESDTISGTIRQESVYGARKFELKGILLYEYSGDLPMQAIGTRKISAQRALSELFRPLVDLPLVYGFNPGRALYCQRIGDIQRKDFINHAEISIQMLARDPFFYEPWQECTVGDGDTIELTGNFSTGPKIWISGDSIGNRTADPYLSINGVRAENATAIGPGDTLHIDSANRICAYNGTQAKNFNEEYPLLAPGTNIVYTNLDSVTIRYRPCWLT